MLKMPAHRLEHEVLTSDIKFGLNITPFGGITLAGSQNWFELLKAAKIYSVRRKCQPGHTKNDHNKRRERRRSKTMEVKELQETIPVEKKTPRQPIADPLPSRPPTVVKPVIPVISITRASNDSIPDHYISESSDEESDYDDGEDMVYEFPGMGAASTTDMTVENPLFQQKQFQSSYRTPELPKKYWKDVFVESV